jgi:hypothetical protein
MALSTREDCADKTKVFADLSSGYGKQRKWTITDFTFKAPSKNWLETVRPPYKTKMVLAKPSDLIGTVKITGILVSDGKEAESAVGTIKNI